MERALKDTTKSISIGKENAYTNADLEHSDQYDTSPNVSELDLIRYLRTQTGYDGAKLIDMLWQYEGRYLRAERLLHLIDPPELNYFSDLEGDTYPERDASTLSTEFCAQILTIEAVDSQTLKACQKRIHELETKLDQDLRDPKRLSDNKPWVNELAQLKDYLRKNCGRGGKPRNLNLNDNRAYQTVQKAISRFLDYADLDAPNYARELRKHVKVGKECVWLPM